MKTHPFHFQCPTGVSRKEELPTDDGVADLLAALSSRPRTPLSAAVYLIAERRFGNTEDDALEAAARELVDALLAE